MHDSSNTIGRCREDIPEFEALFSTLNSFPEWNLFPNLWKCFSIRDPFAPSMDPSYPSLRGQTKIRKPEGWKFKKNIDSPGFEPMT